MPKTKQNTANTIDKQNTEKRDARGPFSISTLARVDGLARLATPWPKKLNGLSAG